MNGQVFSGCIPALMTPCTSERTPNYDALVSKAQELTTLGMNAVVYCGSMGDWPLLTNEQRMEGVSRLVDAGIQVIVVRVLRIPPLLLSMHRTLRKWGLTV